MAQSTLFDLPGSGPALMPAGDRVVRLRLLVTVATAPAPSGEHRVTVCVAGLSLDLDRPGWIRLDPINFREFRAGAFTKYDVISVDARPSPLDPRGGSWRPIMSTMVVEKPRRPWRSWRSRIDPLVVSSMCAINRAPAGRDGGALTLVRPRVVSALKISPHQGWSVDEQAAIDAYGSPLNLLDADDRTPLAAPRLRGAYRYHCHDAACRGHEQSMVDGEFSALQRRLAHLPDAGLRDALRERFFTTMCAPARGMAFYVDNQTHRVNAFSVLGVYYPNPR